MQAVVRSALLVGLACACSGSAAVTPDATQGSADGGSGAGLYVHWWTDPYIPGSVGTNTSVTSATFRLTSLRVIGDADPGDSRTTWSDFTIHWDADGRPHTISFPQAPTGLYSKVSLAIDGQIIDSSYEIIGTTEVGGVTKPFKIHDLNSLDISLDTSETVSPGAAVDLTVHIDFSNALANVDFTALSVDDGYLDLDTLDAQMPAFRQQLTQSFHVQDGSPQ
jgi:hypothetical protein